MICRDNNPLYESLPSPCPVAFSNICYSLPPPSHRLSDPSSRKKVRLMNFSGRSFFFLCVPLLHWFLGSWRDTESGHVSWPMGLATSGSIVLRLMELMSGRSRPGSSPVKLCCDGYTLQRLSCQVKKNYFNSLRSRTSTFFCQ